MTHFRTKLLIAAFFAAVICSAPAYADMLAKLSITTAQTAQAGAGNCAGASATCTTPAMQVTDGNPANLGIQCNFTYGSGGTSADAWVQTSLDGGTTWVDIAECGFTTTSVRKGYNLVASTPVTTVYTATDGTLTANTSKDGLLSNWYRVKYTTVGTYAGGTTLQIDVATAKSRMTP